VRKNFSLLCFPTKNWRRTRIMDVFIPHSELSFRERIEWRTRTVGQKIFTAEAEQTEKKWQEKLCNLRKESL
jgi:hypothetical protein